MDIPKQLLVFVNPASGKGHAVKEWNKAKPILDKFNVKYQVIMTQYQNHCFDYLLKEDLSNIYGIVLVSGDGLPHEAINALYARQDWEKIFQSITIGVLPGGSGNAFAKTLTKQSQLECNSESCALLIAKGITRQMDLILLEMPQKKVVSFLSLAYAFISEVDLGSESLRFLGGARFDIYGTWRALFQKKYSAKYNNQQMMFRYFLAQKIPYISDNYLSAPAAKIDDGFIDVQYLEAGDWSQLVKLSLKQYDGSHVEIDEQGNVRPKGNWKYEKVKEYTFEPITNCPLSIDGERYPPQPVKATVLNKILKVFCY
ncbi:unnamed protein product [Paramecium sonneborni]|uniref:DAGKc domain-containing protein n=1 Tax=Paramecium sonneborni TaxID=65129 RepID=A0A8S1N939_9CILI|nr:unnamed protein product [Paramecium sonneborni]